MKDICENPYLKWIDFCQLDLCAGLEDVEVGVKKSFSVLKHKPIVGSNAIFAMALAVS